MSNIQWKQCNTFEQENSPIRHALFTRKGGVSTDIYTSCNFGYGSNDKNSNVDENRSRAMQQWAGIPKEQLITLYQVHSAEVVTIDESHKGHQQETQADAMVTRTPGIALGILTADCTPVLFADHKNLVIGAAHAGWGGAFKGICQNVIKEMVALGADEANIQIAIGPTIQQQSYEVGTEFLERFQQQSKENEQFFIPSKKEGHYMFNLPAYVSHQIKTQTAVTKVENCQLDTYSNEDLFFSYRRTCHKNENDYGRNLSAIMVAK